MEFNFLLPKTTVENFTQLSRERDFDITPREILKEIVLTVFLKFIFIKDQKLRLYIILGLQIVGVCTAPAAFQQGEILILPHLV